MKDSVLRSFRLSWRFRGRRCTNSRTKTTVCPLLPLSAPAHTRAHPSQISLLVLPKLKYHCPVPQPSFFAAVPNTIRTHRTQKLSQRPLPIHLRAGSSRPARSRTFLKPRPVLDFDIKFRSPHQDVANQFLTCADQRHGFLPSLVPTTSHGDRLVTSSSTTLERRW